MYYATLLNEIFGEDSSTSNSEMHISATCMSSEDTYCDGIEEKSVIYSATETTNQMIKEDIYIAPGETQTYEITFKFVNTNYNQNYNQGKSFYAQINVGDDTTMYNVNVTAYEGEDLIENFNYEMHSTPRSGSTITGTFSENNVELGSHTVTLTSGSDVYTGSFDLRTSESKGQYSLTAYAEERQNTADIILYFNEDKELESIEIDGGNEKHPLRPIAGTLAQNWQVKADYRLSVNSTTTTDEGLKVQSITFYDDGRIYEDIEPIDVSVEQNGSILLYQDETTKCAPVNTGTDSSPIWTTPSTCYNDYIVANGRVSLPAFSSYLFFSLKNINTIYFNDSINTSNVANMSYMFQEAGHNAQTFELNLSKWDTSKVTDMSNMFYNVGRNANNFNFEGLSNWDTSKVKYMSSMFCNAGYKASIIELDLSNWNTWNVASMPYMFMNFGNSSQTINILGLSNWNTSKVTNMTNMFRGTGVNSQIFELDLSDWNTSNVTNISYMFNNAGYHATTWTVGDLSNWNTSSVKNMSNLFSFAGYSAQTFDIGNLSNWDTSSVTDMSNIFNSAGYSAHTFNIGNLSNWDTSNVADMTSVFSSAGHSVQTFELDLSNWDTSKVTNMAYMFNQAGYNSTTWSVGDISNWDTSKVTNMQGMFHSTGRNVQTFELDLSNWDTSSVTNVSAMFAFAGDNSQTFDLKLNGWDTSKVTNMSYAFCNAGTNAQTFDLKLNGWDTSKVTNMSNMFYCVGQKASYLLDLSGWNVSLVTNHFEFNSGVTNKVLAPTWVN